MAFLGDLVKLAEEIENRDIPQGTHLKSVQKSITDGIRKSIDDPIAVGIEKGIRNFSIKVASKIKPSLPEDIKRTTPKPVELERSLPGGGEATEADLNVGNIINLEFNGESIASRITNVNEDGGRIVARGTDKRQYIYTKTAAGYKLQAVDMRADDNILLAKEGEVAVTNYKIQSVDGSGRYTVKMDVGTDTQLFNLVQDADGGYTLQPVNNTNVVGIMGYKVNIVPQEITASTSGNTSSNTQSVQPQTEAEMTQRSLIQNYQPFATQP